VYDNVLEFKKEKVIKELIPIGYWYSEREPEFPMPTSADEFEHKDEVIEYLNNGEVRHRWRGMSSCRLCDLRHNGSRCLTDRKYIWPEGLAHYVEEHNTPLPEEFIKYILEN